MKLPQAHLKAGVDVIRGAKFRSFWTMLGVIIGVASVIMVVSIGEGIRQQISGQIHHLGQNLITVRPAEIGIGSAGDGSLTGLNVSQPLGVKDVDVISHTKGVAASAPLTVVGGKASGDHGVYRDGFVLGTTSDLPSLLNQSMLYGAFFSSDDNGLNVAVLGQHVAETMFSEDVPLGRSFTFHGRSFIVRGVFNQFTSMPLAQQADFNNAIFIPNDVAENLSRNTAPTYEVLARPAAGEHPVAVESRIRAALSQAHGGDSGLTVASGNQNLSTSNDILSLLTRLIAGVAAISLLVGGIGIMNVMLVSVAERMHEIGIRKAVGATNRQIMSQFMVESATLSLAGGVIGVALAFIIDILLRVFTDVQPSVSWQIVVLAVGVSLLVGVIFGTVPAVKAARKAPIDALRFE
ncbi:MAG TPA: ABC transporter permease [Candidatus Dormibacteraeota bacterium]|nr:ABC transporter permease [Candidatus Dormibacteraeota bacterium]